MRRVLVVTLIVACGSAKPRPAPKPDPRIHDLEQALAKTKDDLAKQTAEADALRADSAELKTKADEAKALQDKLTEVVGKAGEVTTADGAIRLELVDQILFPTGEAELTPSGRDVLGRVGAALKDVEDKQIWVQGHTDDQPIIIKKPKPEPPVAAKPKPKPTKGKGKVEPPLPPPPPPPPPPPNDAELKFVTNWELSAARALTVVHYLQDEAKIDPARLAAVAFGQYRPVSKVKAKNRRIEIVLYPRAKISPK